MNRSFISVIAGGFGTDSSSGNMTSSEDQGEVSPIEADDVCELLMSSKKVMDPYGSNSSSVIITFGSPPNIDSPSPIKK